MRPPLTMPAFPQPGPARGGLRGHRAVRGFTLLELILVLTILALLAAAAVPGVQGLRESQAAREPLNSLAKLAKQTRLRAMHDRRPYQIAFTRTGFKATRYLSPYMQAAQLDEFIQRSAIEAQQKIEAGIAPQSGTENPADAGAAPDVGAIPLFDEWTETVPLPEGTSYTVQEWHEAEPLAIEGDLLKLWVFQPSGMVVPITVSIHHEGTVFTASFSSLTADIVKETATRL